MLVFVAFIVVSVLVFVAAARVLQASPDDPPPPDFNGDEPVRGTAKGVEIEGKPESPAPYRASAGAEVESIPVHFHRGISALLFVCSLVMIAASFLVGFSMNSITGAILLAVSVGYFVQPSFVVFSDRVEHRNLLGMTVRTTALDSIAQLEVTGDGLFVERAGMKKQKLLGFLWTYSSGDLAKVKKRLEKARVQP